MSNTPTEDDNANNILAVRVRTLNQGSDSIAFAEQDMGAHTDRKALHISVRIVHAGYPVQSDAAHWEAREETSR